MTRLYTTLEFILSPMGLMHPLFFFFFSTLLLSTFLLFTLLLSSLLSSTSFSSVLRSSPLRWFSIHFLSALLFSTLLYSTLLLVHTYRDWLNSTRIAYWNVLLFHSLKQPFFHGNMMNHQILWQPKSWGKKPKKPWLSHRIGAPDYVGLVGSVMRSQCLRHSPFDDGFESWFSGEPKVNSRGPA